MSWRDDMCGELRAEHVGRRLTVAGWAARRRDHGGLVFVDLRDRTGILQLVVNPERSPDAAELAKEIRNEFVLRATGEVVARSPETVNPKMATGEVELLVDELEIVSRSTPLPFQLDEAGVDETLRLRYRWLDLRTERMLVRLGGTFGRLSSFIKGAERDLLPVIVKSGGTVDRVNDQLDKMDVVTDSAVSMAESADTAVRAVSTAITTPVKKVSGVASGISHGFAALRARRDVGDAVSVAKEAAARRETEIDEELHSAGQPGTGTAPPDD